MISYVLSVCYAAKRRQIVIIDCSAPVAAADHVYELAVH